MDIETLLHNFDTLLQQPADVAALEGVILQLAVQGQLVPQDPGDEPASELLQRIEAEKARLLAAGELREGKPLPPIQPDEIPYALPDGWAWCRLPDVYYDWGQQKPDKPFTYIDVSSIDNQLGMVKDDLQIINPEDAPSRARKIVKPGTVIYSTVRPYLLNVAVIEQEYEPAPIVSTAFAVMQPFDGIDAKFLYYYLRSKPFTQFVESQMTGMAYPAISDSKFRLGLFPLPPLAEQRRIVVRVDALLAQTHALAARLAQAEAQRLPALRAACAALLDAPDAIAAQAAWEPLAAAFALLIGAPDAVAIVRQTVLQLAVQGRLVPQDPADEPASVLLERVAAEKTQSAKRIISSSKSRKEAPYPLPLSWEWVGFQNITDCRLGKMLDQSKNKGKYYPYLRNLNVQWLRINLQDVLEMRFEDHEIEEFQLKYGDLLVCEGGEPGRCAIWEETERQMMFQKALHRVRPLGNISSKYLLYHLWADAQNGTLAKLFTGATIKHFTGKALANYMIALPPLAEQQRIVARVETLFALCDALEARLLAAEAARSRLLAAVVNGG